jgi:hypothetical protein
MINFIHSARRKAEQLSTDVADIARLVPSPKPFDSRQNSSGQMILRCKKTLASKAARTGREIENTFYIFSM